MGKVRISKAYQDGDIPGEHPILEMTDEESADFEMAMHEVFTPEELEVMRAEPKVNKGWWERP